MSGCPAQKDSRTRDPEAPVGHTRVVTDDEATRPELQRTDSLRAFLADRRTRLMGILNVTPDSFSDGGRFLDPSAAVRHARHLIDEGAEILDIGAESTRPGHEKVPADEQVRRLRPVLEALRAEYGGSIPIPVSIDTTRRTVAEAALDAGASWVNDTTGFGEDPDLASLCRDRGCPVVLMHRFEDERTTGSEPQGRPFVQDLARRLESIADRAIRAGIDRSQILLDPGVGFGTSTADNVAVHAFVEELRAPGFPLLFGTSRKRFLGALTGRQTADRLHATSASTAALALAGVEVLRVHDVGPMRDVVRVCTAIRTGCAKEDPRP